MVDFLLVFHFAELVRGLIGVEPNNILVVKLPILHPFNFAVAFRIRFTFFAVWFNGTDLELKWMFKTGLLQDGLHSIVKINKYTFIGFRFGNECSE